MKAYSKLDIALVVALLAGACQAETEAGDEAFDRDALSDLTEGAPDPDGESGADDGDGGEASAECSLLFDESHNNWDRLSQYALADAALTDQGFSTQAHAAGPITAELLESVSVLYINEPGFGYSAAEQAVIEQWVAAGGGLFVASDCGNFGSINALLNPYSATNLGQCGNFAAVPLSEHEAIGDGDTYWFNFGTGLNFSAAWTVLGTLTGQPILAVREYGEGRVIVSGDNDGFTVGLPYSPVGAAAEENALLFVSLASWLCNTGCVMPPGLEKNGHQPPGLDHAPGLGDECPPGWTRGTKAGW